MEGRLLPSGLSDSLTTDKPVYQAGDAIQFTFTERCTAVGASWNGTHSVGLPTRSRKRKKNGTE
jgi:hypothetical protein